MIDRIRLGTSPLEVPRLALGTMTFGEQNSESGAHAQLDFALDHGIDFIDTAEMYPIPAQARTTGATERIVGNWLKSRPRDRVTLATKVSGPGRGMDWLRTGDRAGLAPLSRKDILLACDASLARLRTDYIDLYQIHWPARNVPAFGSTRFDPARDEPCTALHEQLDALTHLVRAGKVRAIGVSNETAWGLCEFARLAEQYGLPRIATVQNVYNLLSRHWEDALHEAAHRERVSLLAYSPLAFGYLTGKYIDGGKPPRARLTLFGDRWPRYAKPGVAAAAGEYARLAARHGLTPLQLALGFMRSRPFVASTLLGATSVEQLRQAIDAWRTPLPEPVLAEIEALHAARPNPAP